MAVNDSSEIRTAGISIFDSGSRGGFAITGIFSPAVPLGSTIGRQGRNWKSGAGRGAPAPQADRPLLTLCPLPCHFWADNWKRRKGTSQLRSGRRPGCELPRIVDSPLPETRQVLCPPANVVPATDQPDKSVS